MQATHVDPFARPGVLTPAGAEPIVRLTAIEKYFGSNHVLRGCNLEVYPKETICLIGRSGSGKSTLLRCTNFLEEPTVGTVEVGGLVLEADALKSRSREHREHIRQIRLAAQMVFQDFNLFPHMTVLGNLIEAPIRVRGMKKDDASLPRSTSSASAWPRSATPTPRACPAARSSASRSHGRSRWNRRCCCSTNRPRPSTRPSWARSCRS
jgi:ABC-type glutathione transport system ATPase component